MSPRMLAVIGAACLALGLAQVVGQLFGFW